MPGYRLDSCSTGHTLIQTNPLLADDALGLIADARSRGVRATCDMYPYEAGSTYLNQLLPPWVFEGGVDRMLERLISAVPS